MAIFGAGVGSSDGSGKSELMQLMEKWRDGIALIKPKGRNSLPGFVDFNVKSPRSGMAPPECTDCAPR